MRDSFEAIASVRDDSSAAIFETVSELVETTTDDEAVIFRRFVGGASDDGADGILYEKWETEKTSAKIDDSPQVAICIAPPILFWAAL